MIRQRNQVISLIITCFGCDQLSKHLVRINMKSLESIEVIKDILFFTRVENKGAFLSVGEEMNSVLKSSLLSFIPLLALFSAICYMLYFKRDNQLFISGISFVIGGGLGNVFDRILYRSVLDFIHIKRTFFQLGIFNIADIAILIGVCILILNVLKNRNIALR